MNYIGIAIFVSVVLLFLLGYFGTGHRSEVVLLSGAHALTCSGCGRRYRLATAEKSCNAMVVTDESLLRAFRGVAVVDSTAREPDLIAPAEAPFSAWDERTKAEQKNTVREIAHSHRSRTWVCQACKQVQRYTPKYAQ